MDLIETRSDGNEHLLVSGLTRYEIDEVMDWWRYTKPFGPDVRIVAKGQPENNVAMRATGTDVEPTAPSEGTPSKMFVS